MRRSLALHVTEVPRLSRVTVTDQVGTVLGESTGYVMDGDLTSIRQALTVEFQTDATGPVSIDIRPL